MKTPKPMKCKKQGLTSNT